MSGSLKCTARVCLQRRRRQRARPSAAGALREGCARYARERPSARSLFSAARLSRHAPRCASGERASHVSEQSRIRARLVTPTTIWFHTSILPLTAGKKINRLYSSFDLDRHDAVDFRELMAAQRCLWRLTETSTQKLGALWDIFTAPTAEDEDERGAEASRRLELHEHSVAKILLTCSVAVEEEEAMHKLIESTQVAAAVK